MVNLHYRDIYSMLIRLTRNAGQAEDLTQETFLLCWQRAATFQGRSSLKTWLRRIAYNRFLDALRRDRLPPAQLLPVDLTDPGSGPGQQAQFGDDLSHVLEAMQGLPAELRDVLILHYQQEMSLQEVADVLDCPLGTAKWRVHKALRKLREILNRGVSHD
jgi:RNA polymerase sigma-70 factor (ECF subfamily)